MKNRLLHLLNIRSDEAWLVTNLFWLQFFQGFGIAVFSTVGLAMFLEKFQVTELPKVYLFSAILLWISGFVYSKFEHAFSVKKVALGVIVFIALSILLLRFNFFLTDSPWLIFAMLCWYYVVYLLSNLEFWGVAALLFDIRQSKRLFSMVGAGDIPAKLIGYLAVPVLIHFTGSENLLLLSFVSILCSLFFYFKLDKAGKLNLHVAHSHTNNHAQATQSVKEIVNGFFGNRMIATVALLSFTVLTVVTIITFAFYAEIKYGHMHDDKEFASFIGLFYAGGKLLGIVIRLLVTGRLASALGTKGSLLVSPVILFLFLITFLLSPLFTHDHYIELYLFGLMAILTDVLKTSLQDPVFLSLMQPLSAQLRLKGHTVVKGIMDPFALAFSAGLIFLFIHVTGSVDLFHLSYLLFALIIVWVVMIFVVDREYVRTLVTALHKRYSVGNEIDLHNEKTRGVLLEKITSGERGEAIYILNLIEKNYSYDHEELVVRAIEHSKTEVRMEAIQLAERKKIVAALPFIEKIISEKNDLDLLPEAVKAKCMLLPDELETLDAFIEDHNPRVMKAAIIGLMKSGGISAVVTAGQRLLLLISSAKATERKIGAEIIGELEVHSFYKPLLGLLKDEDEEVVKAAIAASGKVKNARLIHSLLQLFVHHQYQKHITDALQKAGDASLKEIKHTLLHEPLTHQQQTKLVMLCGRIGTKAATVLLEELVWKKPALRSEIFHALHLCNYHLDKIESVPHVELMHHYINVAIKLVFMLRETEKTKTAKILEDALHLELNEIRESLLLLFSFVYDREKILKAKSAFAVHKKENIANALEVIEIEVPKDISLRFIKLFESGSVADKCTALQVYFRDSLTYAKVIDHIMENTHHHYHRWTRAAALYSTIFYNGKEKAVWLEKAKEENDILLTETAQKILSETI